MNLPSTFATRLRRFATVLSLGIVGCSPDDATGNDDAPSGTRPVLGLAPNPRSVPPPQPSDLVAAVDATIAIGARGIVQGYSWSALEPDSARLNVQRLIDDVRYARSRGLTVLLGIQTINTVRREVPADVASVPWDDVRMVRRFERLLTALQPVLGEVTYLAVGNEVADYLGRTAEWPAYTRFLTQVVAATRQRAPTVKVGATLEYVVAAAQTANTRALIAVGDVAIFTLYPLNLGGFSVAPPTVAGTLFDNMMVLAGDKPVVLQELGYPASPLNGSSERCRQHSSPMRSLRGARAAAGCRSSHCSCCTTSARSNARTSRRTTNCRTSRRSRPSFARWDCGRPMAHRARRGTQCARRPYGFVPRDGVRNAIEGAIAARDGVMTDTGRVRATCPTPPAAPSRSAG